MSSKTSTASISPDDSYRVKREGTTITTNGNYPLTMTTTYGMFIETILINVVGDPGNLSIRLDINGEPFLQFDKDYLKKENPFIQIRLSRPGLPMGPEERLYAQITNLKPGSKVIITLVRKWRRSKR